MHMKKFLMRLYEEDDGIGTVEIILFNLSI